MSFKTDPNIQKMAKYYSSEAIKFAKSQFDVNLDLSDQSIEKVEEILEIMY